MSSPTYKIALLGEEGVGKTALLVRFLCHRYIGEYDPSIEDIYRRNVKVDGVELTVDFLDTSSKRSETSVKDSFMKRANGFIVIYSMTDRESFLAVPKYKEMIDRSREFDNLCPVSVVLLANKGDLHDHRIVSSKDGKLLASQYGWTFAEVSAALSDGVDKVFHELIRELEFNNAMMHLGDLKIERPRSLSLNSVEKHAPLKTHRISDVSSSPSSDSLSDSEHIANNMMALHSKHSFNLKKLLHLRTDMNNRRGSH